MTKDDAKGNKQQVIGAEEKSLEMLVKRVKAGDETARSLLMEAIARDIYAQPRLYGLKSVEEAGDIFARYWNRLLKLPERYEFVGRSFKAYLVTVIKYMAISIRRQHTEFCCREEAYIGASKHELYKHSAFAGYPDSGFSEYKLLKIFPDKNQQGLKARAFRKRFLFICLKNALLLNDDTAMSMAKTVGIDGQILLHLLEKARKNHPVLKTDRKAYEKSRNSAWLRMCYMEQRLTKEVDPHIRRVLTDKIKKNRLLYYKAARRLYRSSLSISNKDLAGFLCLPKGTIDSGIARISKMLGDMAETEKKD
ncbi:hypothetical protein MASR2M29_12740 [Spirochaetota bacterium]